MAPTLPDGASGKKGPGAGAGDRQRQPVGQRPSWDGNPYVWTGGLRETLSNLALLS